MEEQQEGGKHSSAGGAQPRAPLGGVPGMQAGAGAELRPRLRLTARRERAAGLQLSPGSWRGAAVCGRGAGTAFGAAGSVGLGPQCCISAACFHQLGTACPLCTFVPGVCRPPKALAVPGKTNHRPLPSQQLAQGPSDAQMSCSKGCPGDTAGPPLPPHTEAGSWGSRPWLGAAFSLVLKNLPGETISSDPKT